LANGEATIQALIARVVFARSKLGQSPSRVLIKSLCCESHKFHEKRPEPSQRLDFAHIIALKGLRDGYPELTFLSNAKYPIQQQADEQRNFYTPGVF